MAWFFAIAAASILFLFLHFKFANSFEKRSREPSKDPVFYELSQYIDTSLKGYPERVRYKDVYGTDIWTCHSSVLQRADR